MSRETEENQSRPKVSILTPQDAMLEDLLDRCVGLARKAGEAAEANDGQSVASLMKQYQQMMSQAEVQLRVIVLAREAAASK